MAPFHWTCPYCDRDTTISDSNYSHSHFTQDIKSEDGYRYFQSFIVVCPNPECTKFTLALTMFEYKRDIGDRWVAGKALQTWNLIPPSTAKVFPDDVPKAIRDDYLEATLIRDLSPKASATLSRRCLQGIIRDFWKSRHPVFMTRLRL